MASQLGKNIKKMFNKLYESKTRCDFVAGVVISEGNPPTIGITEMQPLPRQAVIIPSDFLNGDGKLKKGERVYLLRKENGQAYMVLHRQ